MKRKRHTEERTIAIRKEHEAGVKAADLCREHGMREASFYNWKAEHGGLEVSEAKRLKGLENENAKLKKHLGDAVLDNSALKDLLTKMVTPAAKRCAVFDMSERQACRRIGCVRMRVRVTRAARTMHHCWLHCGPWRVSAG